MTDLTWVLSSCALILAVIALRAAFGKRMRPGLRYALWGLVLLRLLYPGTVLSSPVSVQGVAEQSEVVRNFEVLRGVDTIEYMDIDSSENSGYIVCPKREGMSLEWGTPERFERMQTTLKVRDVLEPIWFAGIAITSIVFLTSNLRFYAQLRKRRKPLNTDCPLRVYAVENLSSSCLFGNSIYVAAETAADEAKLRHVLAHELSHHQHGDHVWALLRCVALALHWYNPLVWWAAALSRQDSELCADAGALERLGEAERENYGATLIELSARHAPRASLLCAATTMTNGKKSLKERVTMIARRPRMTVAVVIAVVLIAAVAAGGAFAGAAARENEATTDETKLKTSANADVGQTVSWAADLDSNGTAERIAMDASALVPGGAARIWLEDANGNELCDLGEIGQAHTGWRTLALTERDGGTYLLEYSPTIFQGEAEYSYTLMRLSGGNLAVVEHERAPFSTNPNESEDNNVENMRGFAEKANDVWSHSRLLFTTDQEVLAHLYDADTGKAVEANGRYYIAAEGETVRYYETMYGLLDGEADTPLSPGAPSEAEVLAMRERAEAGMSDDEVKYLTEMVMVEHYWWEYQYLNLKTFDQMSDPDSLLWNYIDQAGEVQIGWVLDESIDKDTVCAQEGLTEDEFYTRYAQKAIEPNNTHDAESFRRRITALKASVKSGLLDEDFDRMIALYDRARETHDVGCLAELYHMLHDMDYYLLRYGPSAVGSRTKGPSIATNYYDCLSIWQ